MSVQDAIAAGRISALAYWLGSDLVVWAFIDVPAAPRPSGVPRSSWRQPPQAGWPGVGVDLLNGATIKLHGGEFAVGVAAARHVGLAAMVSLLLRAVMALQAGRSQ